MTSATVTDRSAARGCTCFRLRRLTRRVTQRYDKALAPVGLRVTQFSLLAAMHRDEGCTITGLARAMAMDRTTLQRNLRPLQQAGYLTVDAGDSGNTRAVCLTDAGRDAFQRARPLWRKVQDEVAAALGADTLAALHELLEGALARLDG